MGKYVLFLLFTTLSFSQNALEKAERFISERNYNKAQREMLTYLEHDPNNPIAIELLGDAYGYQKKWDLAIEQYEVLTESAPNKAKFFYKYGGALGMKAKSVSKIRALGFIGDIKSAFLKAAELDPNHIDARWALVELYVSLPGIVGGSFSKALDYANELQNLSKVDGYLAKGYVYEYDDEPQLAEKYYKLAIKEGGSVTCFNKLTQFYEGQDQPEKAIINLEEGQQKLQRNAMHYQIGKVCAEYKIQLDKGEQCLEAYLANHTAKDGVPKAWAYYRLAQISNHKNKKEEALRRINKAISDLPEVAIFQDFKGSI